MLLKRKVKKLIDKDEDARKPAPQPTTSSPTSLQTQGIDVTRRTVAKYREDLRIPQHSPAQQLAGKDSLWERKGSHFV